MRLYIFNNFKNLIIFLVFSLVFSTSFLNSGYAQQYVSQGAWAVGLVKGLGWESKGIPQQPTLSDYLDLLSGRNFITVNLKDFKTRLGIMPDTLRYTLNIAHSGRYHLIAYVYGDPIMFTIDNQPSVSSIYSNGWNYEDMGMFILSRGTHKLSITIPKNSSIGALYLSSYLENAIQPKAGWEVNKALDYGAEARTIVLAMNVEGELPVKSQIPSTIRIGQNVEEFIFQAPVDPVINFSIVFGGTSKGYVMVDNSIVMPYDTSAEQSLRINLKTLNISQGQHIAYLKVLSGQMPVSFIINQYNDTPDAYIALLRTKGYIMGLAYQPVPFNIAQSSLGTLIASITRKVPENAYYLAQMPAKENELPSQRALRTYKEPISPMRPFE